MSEEYKTVSYKGYTIEVHHDFDPVVNPRTDWDNLGTMVCFHKRYTLGDKDHGFATPDELLEFVNDNKIISLPVYLYDHSGLTVRTYPFECPWDSGLLGYIYVSHKDVLKEFSRKRMSDKLEEKAADILRAEVRYYDMYLTGEVYGYVLKNPDGEELDSCWGYFGDPEESGLLKDARWAIEYYNAERMENSFREYLG